MDMRELRQALGDNPRTPQFIETVHRQGYRFIGLVESPEPRIRSQGNRTIVPLTPRSSIINPMGPVGRKAELEQLRIWLEKASQGERQVVLVTGEAGIGKTTVWA